VSTAPINGNRHTAVLAVWAAVLVAGFALIVAFGGPTATTADELDAAYHPTTPVSEAAARSSAATIVRLQYQEYESVEPAVSRADDFGIERFVVVYSSEALLSGVRIAIEVETGEVTTTTFP
jgi:uncharacterized iron-regulated membrane protein